MRTHDDTDTLEITLALDKRWLRMLVLAVTVAAVALPAGVVLASHTFDDVDTTDTHHDAIGAVADAGVTEGCDETGTRYCPDEFVTRAQMASFMDRLGALSGQDPSVNADQLDGMDAGDLAQASEVPATELQPVTGTSSFQPPDPLPAAELDESALEATFTTGTAGRLHLTYQAVFELECDSGTEWAWLVLDGTPIPDSATRLPPDSVGPVHHTFTAVTPDIVPAGTHTLEVHAGAEGCGAAATAVAPYTTGTVIVLG